MGVLSDQAGRIAAQSARLKELQRQILDVSRNHAELDLLETQADSNRTQQPLPRGELIAQKPAAVTTGPRREADNPLQKIRLEPLHSRGEPAAEPVIYT